MIYSQITPRFQFILEDNFNRLIHRNFILTIYSSNLTDSLVLSSRTRILECFKKLDTEGPLISKIPILDESEIPLFQAAILSTIDMISSISVELMARNGDWTSDGLLFTINPNFLPMITNHTKVTLLFSLDSQKLP